MSNNYLPVQVSVDSPVRGPGNQPSNTFVAQSMNATFAWGTSPGTATIVYVGNAAGVQTGAYVELRIGAHFFAGICKTDVLNVGSGEGVTRTLQFSDLREFLTWDWTFCCFNKPDVRLIGGLRIKRYKHIFPAAFDTLTWQFTNDPLSTAEILDLIFSGPTIGTQWAWDDNGLLEAPVFDFDCLNGKRLDAVLNDICERSGCVVGLFSQPGVPFNLVFTRKGYGSIPLPPVNSDNRRTGISLSGHPTAVRVLGERNLYQVMDVPMQPDWARGWEQFIAFELFADDIYHRLGYDQAPGDDEGYIGRQNANARALSITVREYVELRGNEGALFADTRKFAGRWRMDMPAALYISTLLFRAFRPVDSFVLVNNDGNQIPLSSAEIADRLLCRVFQVDPTGGQLSFDPSLPCDGNGFAIAQGYLVGADLFKAIKSDQFTLDFFQNADQVWQHIPFQIDDSGEGVRFIIFDQPVILSNNLVSEYNGHSVINAQFTLEIPAVKAALVFEAERFSYIKGSPGRSTVENVSGLNLEVVVAGGTYTEIPYANGVGAFTWADRIGASVLLRQYYYSEGGFKHIWQPGTNPAAFGIGLDSMIDRVQISTSPKDGTFEIVDYTNERQREFFEPERELERRTQTNSLFPGQEALRVQAEYARKLAAAFKQLPDVGRELKDLLTGAIGSEEPLSLTWFSGLGIDLQGELMPAGTVIRKSPSVLNELSGRNSGTVATDPTDIGQEDNIFVGVTVRDAEDPNRPFKVQRTGIALCRVQGPVSVHDVLGLADEAEGWEYLVLGGSPTVGRALQSIPNADVRLIQVDLNSSQSAAKSYAVMAVQSDYLVCYACDPDGSNLGSEPIYVAMEALHRNSLTQENIFGIDHNYTYASNGADASDWEGSGLGGIGNVIRTDQFGAKTETQVLTPPWRLGEIIKANPAVTGVQADTGEIGLDDQPVMADVTLEITGRSTQWAKKSAS